MSTSPECVEPRTDRPSSPGRRRSRRAPAASGWLLALLALAALWGTPAPGRAAPATRADDERRPPIEARLARERARRLGDIQQCLAELPAADNALRAAGPANPDRARRISRLLGLRGRGLGVEPESMAVAAGLLDLLLGDEALMQGPVRERLTTASSAALQLLLADPPRPRARTGEWLQSLRDRSRKTPSDWTMARTPNLGPLVTPLPPARPTGVASVLLEGIGREAWQDAPGWELPPHATAHWVPGSHRVLIRDAALLSLLDVDGMDGPSRLGSLCPDGPLAIAPSGEYVAAATTGTARDTLQSVTLFRMAGRVDGVVIDRGRFISALAWSPRGTRLAIVMDGQLRLNGLDNVTSRGVPLGFETELADTTLLFWSPDGRRLVVADLHQESSSSGPGRTVLRLFDTTAAPRLLDTTEAPPLTFAAWAPDGRSLLLPDASDGGGLVSRDVGEERFGPPAAVALPTRGALGKQASLVEFACSPRRDRLATRFRLVSPAGPGSEPMDLYETGLLGPSRFLNLSGIAGLQSAGPVDTTRLSPVASTAIGIAWHPGGRWCAITHELADGRPLLVLHDALTGDAFPLGDGTGRAGEFSTDGRRLLWRELDPRASAGHRLLVRSVESTPTGLNGARGWDATGFDALNMERPSDALPNFRNATRLASDVASYRNRTARAYRALAEPMPVGGLQGWYLEGAARAATTALELDGKSTEVRVEFMEAQLLRAYLVGQRLSSALQDAVELELSSADAGALYDARGNRVSALMDLIVQSLLWEPRNERLRVMYEGLAMRWRDSESSQR